MNAFNLNGVLSALDDPFSVPGYGPQPGASDFFDSMVLSTARNDPFIQNLLASVAAQSRPTGPDWYEPSLFETYQSIPEGSRYNRAKDMWLLPDGSVKPADSNTRPSVLRLTNFGKSFSSAFNGVGT